MTGREEALFSPGRVTLGDMLDPALILDDPSLATLRGAWVAVDLGAIASNVRQLRAWLSPHTHLMAVVKADGYGHGSLAVARTAISSGADWIGVATVAEGIRLRQAGIRSPLLLLSLTQMGAYETAICNDLQLTVSSAAALRALSGLAGGLGRVARVHIKVDTGMTRVGASVEELPELLRLAQELDHLLLEGISSHLASAEDTADPATERQLSRFRDAVVGSPLPGGILRHVANSAATLYHPRAHWDMVRPGLMIYGVAPDLARSVPFPLEPAMSVHARIAQVREVPAGVRIGYGGRFTTPQATRLAVVPVGYADGLVRALSGKLEVLVGDQARPLVGTISMDQCVVDCGDVPVEVGQEIVLLGRQGQRQVTVERWAEAAGTIPYEIMCGLNRRLPKVFLR